MGLLVDRLELQLSGVLLTEQFVDCWNGFYARVVLTYYGAPAVFSQPYARLWALLLHLGHEDASGGISQHIVFIPGDTSLLFSYEFRAMGIAERWQEWVYQMPCSYLPC